MTLRRQLDNWSLHPREFPAVGTRRRTAALKTLVIIQGREKNRPVARQMIQRELPRGFAGEEAGPLASSWSAVSRADATGRRYRGCHVSFNNKDGYFISQRGHLQSRAELKPRPGPATEPEALSHDAVCREYSVVEYSARGCHLANEHTRDLG